jgi:hypothetical protein
MVTMTKRSVVPERLKRIAAELANKNSGLFERLVESVRHYTIAFVGLPNTSAESPCACGTATLVIVDGEHYFLTAEHVWRKLQKFLHVGITLAPDIDQRFTIPRQLLFAHGPSKPAAKEDGPDIVFLKIPAAKLGEIKGRKSFYSLGQPVAKRLPAGLKAIEVRILLGAPGEKAKLTTPTNLDLTIQAIMADAHSKRFTKGRYDYIDSKEFFGAHGFPKSYAGFNGGGLWRVFVYLDPKTGEVTERRRLAGMAFYEFPAKRKYRVIRCHGARSIDVVKRTLAAKSTKKTEAN